MEVEPVLASTVYEADLAKTKDGTPLHIKTGLQPVSQLLGGGFDYGSISCLSAEDDTVCPEVVFDTAISHLLDHAEAKMTAVLHASSNSFDIRRLRDRLVQALISKGTVQANAKSVAMEALKRITLMRVFDFMGMTESIAEYHEHLEHDARNAAAEALAPVPAHQTTIPDSQSDGEDEEMLVQPMPLHAETHGQASVPVQTHLLLVDSFSNLVQPILRSRESQVPGQVLLDSFMRTLRHLTYAFNVCTFLVCDTDLAKDEISSPSIFGSCTALPGLGMTVAPLIDLHILIHRVPQTAQDARARYSTQPIPGQTQPGMVSVLEIVQDRHSAREGRWTTVSIPLP